MKWKLLGIISFIFIGIFTLNAENGIIENSKVESYLNSLNAKNLDNNKNYHLCGIISNVGIGPLSSPTLSLSKTSYLIFGINPYSELINRSFVLASNTFLSNSEISNSIDFFLYLIFPFHYHL